MSQRNIPQAVEELRALLGDRLSTGSSVKALHSRGEGLDIQAMPDAVAFPDTTDEVSAIMRICSAHRCPVVAYGIGSSLEGHVTPLQGGVSIDTSRMNKVLRVNDRDMDAVVQPGVTRTQLNEALRATGLMFTVDPGADATLGGMAATRASGTNTVRYGTIRENILALEVVLADGQVIRTGTRARKSAAGYDLTHLMIGSEGTLGIITELTVRLHGQPESIMAATCAFESIEGAVDAVILAIQSGLPMARIELADALTIKAINRDDNGLSLPEKPHLFLEFHGSETSVGEQVETFREICDEFGASDFNWASRTEDRNRLWAARHHAYYASKALRPGAEGLSTDCCVPISALAECIAAAQQAVAESGLLAPLVGHVGDGNFHLLPLFDPKDEAERAAIQTLLARLNQLALDLGGTVTGEHGIGVGKQKYMAAEHGAALSVMVQIKRALDPDNILNPGKMVALN